MEAAHNHSFIQRRPELSILIAASSIILLIVGILAQINVVKGLNPAATYSFLALGVTGTTFMAVLAIRSCQKTDSGVVLDGGSGNVAIVPLKTETLGNMLPASITPETINLLRKWDESITEITYKRKSNGVEFSITQNRFTRQFLVPHEQMEEIADVAITLCLFGIEALNQGKITDFSTVKTTVGLINDWLDKIKYKEKHPEFMNIVHELHALNTVKIFIQDTEKSSPEQIFSSPIQALTVAKLIGSIVKKLSVMPTLLN